MQRIFVTGGAGYIGSHFVNRAKETFEITVGDNFREGRNNILKDPRVAYLDIDIRDKEALSAAFRQNKFDAVVHFAALASVPGSVATPAEYYETNIAGGLNLLSAMRETGVQNIIFSSSASVYGEPTTEVIREDHPKEPTNPYGYTKLVFEHVLRDFHRAYGMNSVSFRYFCAAGCDESGGIGEYHSPETHVIPCLLETALGKREKFFAYGNDYPTPDGTGIRDYIHVNDLADAHLLAMRKLLAGETICESFNLGINRGFSVMELVRAAEKVTGKPIPLEIKERRPGDPSRLIADASRAHEFLGWKPQYTDIERIIGTAYNFWKTKA